MELSNSFEVARPISDAWTVLTDVERIAPCLPGAQLQEVEGDEYRGVVKVKVGPITAQYKGAATFAERHDADFRAVLNAKGRDTRGAGNAEAVITARLEALSDSTTQVNVDTDLKITGKVAQFGGRAPVGGRGAHVTRPDDADLRTSHQARPPPAGHNQGKGTMANLGQ